MSEQNTGPDTQPETKNTPRASMNPAWTDDLQRLYELMFGTSGDIEEEWRSYQDYWGFDPHNRRDQPNTSPPPPSPAK